MNIPCDKRVDCDCTTLLTNYSSEDPDRLVHLGRSFGNPGVPPMVIIGGGGQGCVTFSSSLLSETDANQCAAVGQLECALNATVDDPCLSCRAQPIDTSNNASFGGFRPVTPGVSTDGCCDPDAPTDCCCEDSPGDPNEPDDPTGPDDPSNDPERPKLYLNDPQTCTVSCPNGTTFSYTIPYGKFAAISKALANRQAYSAACFEAEQKRICADEFGGANPCKTFCEGSDPEFQIPASNRAGDDLTFDLQDGSLPAGMFLGADGVIAGAPSQAGQVTSADIKIQAPDGTFIIKSYCFSVMGIVEDALSDGECGVPYTDQVHATGGTAPYTFSGINFPAGLSISASTGVISGTPSEAGTFGPTVSVKDATDATCGKELTLTINGVLNNPQTVNVPCLSGGPNIPVTVPAGMFCTATTTVNAQDKVDIKAWDEAANQGAALQTAAGCACVIDGINQDMAEPPNPNVSGLTLHCVRVCHLNLMFSFGGGLWIQYGLLAINPGTYTFCQLFSMFIGQPCIFPFLVPGRTYVLESGGSELAWFST